MLTTRALHWVPTPTPIMPMTTHARGFWVGMGGHGCNIVGRGWAWVDEHGLKQIILEGVIDLGKNEIIAAVSLALPMNRDTTAKFNILLWWKLKGAPTFPIMSRVARLVLCIPASNSKSESNFSDAGNTLTKKRSGLKPTIVNDLLFVRSNQDLV